MSYYDYKMSQEINAYDYPFYALIMAAFRQADTDNLGKLRQAFPKTWAEFEERYNTPGGLSVGELKERIVSELPKTLLGRKVMIMDASPRHINLVLGDFDDYDLRTKEEKDEQFVHPLCPKQFELDYDHRGEEVEIKVITEEEKREIREALAAEYEIMKDEDGTKESELPEGERHQNMMKVHKHLYGPEPHPLDKYFGPEVGYWEEEQDEDPSD